MKKLLPLALCLVLALTGCAQAEELTGKAEGYGGELTVAVRKNGDTLVGIEVTSHQETESIAGNALTQIPQDILANNGTEGVDVVSGATYTSNAIIQAVNNALGLAPNETGAAAATAPKEMGLGLNNTGRIGPGKDSADNQIYSFNEVYVLALFDDQGRVTDIHIDQLEVFSGNATGDGPKFSGFPGQGTDNNDDAFQKEIDGWVTKRERGDAYTMAAGSWASQMDAFQRAFVGKTVEEIETWYLANSSDINGRLLTANSEATEDKAKFDNLSEEEKAKLADITAHATISLTDAHGNILAAIKDAYANRVPLGETQPAATENAPAKTAPTEPITDIVPPANEPAAEGEPTEPTAEDEAAVG